MVKLEELFRIKLMPDNNSKQLMSGKFDFVIPLKEQTIIFGSVIQALDRLHSPRRIIVITDLENIEMKDYGVDTPIEYVNKKEFFGKEHLSRSQMELFFNECIQRNPGEHTKFGWWYQQFIKLGAGEVIDGLSEYYVVWDADLIPFVKWELYGKDDETGEQYSCTAILQEQPFHETSKIQYSQAIRNLIRMEPLFPVTGNHPTFKASTELSLGTFMPFHMVLKKEYLKELFDLIVDVAATDLSSNLSARYDGLWQYIILSQSSELSFFSEFQLYQTYCLTHAKEDNRYYPYPLFGSSSARFPDGGVFLDKLKCTYDLQLPLSYDDIIHFVKQETGDHDGALFKDPISYLVVDRV